MAKKSGRSGRLSFLWKTMLLGMAALTAMGPAAKAEELQDWQYDEQTRSLTLVLPDSVTPLVSVLAPDQLLLELPDTQVGNVMGQTVQDGLVENIVLEQATPETVWVVMEFSAGTVLAASQNAIPLAETANGDQQWQVRPALTATSRRAVGAQSVPATAGASASSLRTPVAELAQVPDFSDLPVLEPAVPDESVNVPPLVSPSNESVTVPPLEASAPAASPSSDDSLDAVAESFPVFDVEVIPAEQPVVSEPGPVDETLEPVASSENTASEAGAVPVEPPFLGEIEPDDVAIEGVPIEGEIDPAIEPLDPIFVELEVVEADREDSTVVEAEFDTESDLESVDAAVAANSDVLVEDSANSRIASGREMVEADEARAAEPLAETFDETAIAEEIRPANVNRWPEPIPFGQPLPR